jgi:hypothetical protein
MSRAPGHALPTQSNRQLGIGNDHQLRNLPHRLEDAIAGCVCVTTQQLLAGDNLGAAILFTSGIPGAPKGCLSSSTAAVTAEVWCRGLGRDAAGDRPGDPLLPASGADPRQGLFSGDVADKIETDAAWRGGWFLAGDSVTCDAAGVCCFSDRPKHKIRLSGDKFSPASLRGDRTGPLQLLGSPSWSPWKSCATGWSWRSSCRRQGTRLTRILCMRSYASASSNWPAASQSGTLLQSNPPATATRSWRKNSIAAQGEAPVCMLSTAAR